MQNTIDPIPVALIEQELTLERFIRKTVKAGNLIYIINAHNAPNTLKEIGRLREIAFRDGGGGSGKSIDLDEFDIQDIPYQQLIVWNPDAHEIIGGYRFYFVKHASYDMRGQPHIAMEHIMHFSPLFIQEYSEHVIEMGRAFIQPKYQSKREGTKSLYALDNLWDGIGALMAMHKEIKYLIGKVTIYSTMHTKARLAIEFYLHKYFEDTLLICGKNSEVYDQNLRNEMELLFDGQHYSKAYRLLNKYVKSYGECVPPLIHAYIDLSDSMVTFGTVFDSDFGSIYDTGMLLQLKDVYPRKRERYIDSYYAEQTIEREI